MGEERICRICGCKESETPKFYPKSMLCNRHYIQMYRHGRIIEDKQRNHYDKICSICGDTESSVYRKWSGKDEFIGMILCQKHYSQIRVHHKIIDANKSHKNRTRICEVCNSNTDVIYCRQIDKMVCRRHYDQVYLYGKILERTRYDRNDYNIVESEHDKYIELILRDGKHNEIEKTIIDYEDLEEILQYKWRLGTWGYVEGLIDGKQMMLQKFLLKTNELVDHIDRNPLNNRKSNLRVSNKSLNAVNCDLRKNNTSGVTGVSYDKRTNNWRAYITFNGKRIELGLYRNIDDAIKIRLQAELKYFGIEFAPQKHLFKQYDIQ